MTKELVYSGKTDNPPSKSSRIQYGVGVGS